MLTYVASCLLFTFCFAFTCLIIISKGVVINGRCALNNGTLTLLSNETDVKAHFIAVNNFYKIESGPEILVLSCWTDGGVR